MNGQHVQVLSSQPARKTALQFALDTRPGLGLVEPSSAREALGSGHLGQEPAQFVFLRCRKLACRFDVGAFPSRHRARSTVGPNLGS